jgi:hypothetical protein
MDSPVAVQALELPQEQRRQAIRQIRRYVVQLTGSQMPDPDKRFEIRDGKTVIGKVLTAASLKLGIEPRQIQGDRTLGQPFTCSFFLCMILDRKRRNDLRADIFDRVHDFVA